MPCDKFVILPGPGTLMRLLRDRRAATLPMIAAAILPITGMVGGALDLGRLYLVKTRLQHACDAGALAGRKQMGAGAWTTTGATSSNAVAQQFFTGNFPNNSYGATGTTKNFTESNGVVSGTASTTVSMTLMAVFSSPDRTLSVACSAQEEVPNTDVVFVLDTTESMSEQPDGSNHLGRFGTPDGTAKITTLKAAVKCFYEALAKRETNEATCDAIAGVMTTSRLRFGLVPYATNVNISRLGLPDAYFATSWSYQSRKWESGEWKYRSVPLTLTGFKNSTTTFDLPLGNNGASKSFTWGGCIEENAPLTNINTKPSTANTTRYAPLIPDAVFYRKQTITAYTEDTNDSNNPTVTPGNLQSAQFGTSASLFPASIYPYASCPSPAWSLQEYNTDALAGTFVNRVNEMRHAGNTRHDIGMLWGGRLISPNGIYSATNGTPSNLGPLYRHVIFMTDGDAKANECDYATYGIPWFDKRENGGAAVTGTKCNDLGTANAELTAAVYTRLAALCTAVKAESNTILWVISFGSNDLKVSEETKGRLRTCATGDNYFFNATTNDSLKDAFKRIAAQISQLRLKS